MASWLTQQSYGSNALRAVPSSTSDLLDRQRKISAQISVSNAAPSWLASAATVKPPAADKPRSIWEQVTHLVAGIPRGVAGLLGEALETAVVVPRLGYDLLT